MCSVNQVPSVQARWEPCISSSLKLVLIPLKFENLLLILIFDSFLFPVFGFQGTIKDYIIL